MRLTTSYNLLTAGAIVKYHCNYCQEDIAGIRVECADCSDFDLCLQDCGNVPVFQSPNAWKAKEEMMLLDAVEHYGFGNWEDIAESVNGKTADGNYYYYFFFLSF
ncbi:transcriptional adapter 2B-like isoform X2 [Centruroides sculpturatus]|uniref:transcriptional adapter 2B-like isoform X2 n=1 Tax=Centruroides sculpturatus TaxID=218467 RepID=UPI000C6CF516|nr:transcriptional adapter 2B-like isoform X2 [Centruroides sculpturatus]